MKELEEMINQFTTDKSTLLERLKACRVLPGTVRQRIPLLFIISLFGDVPLFFLGSISMIVGHVKSFKSRLVWHFIAVLSRTATNSKIRLSDREIKIVLFDSEQGDDRISNLMNEYGLSQSSSFEAYSTLRLSPVERFELIEFFIISFDVTIAFVDLGTDLVDSYNDLTECSYRIDQLLILAQKKGVHICFTTHLGKNSGMASGHWGSTALRRCELIIEVSRRRGCFRVSCQHSRDQKFESFWMKIENGQTVLMEEPPASTSGASRKSDFQSVSPAVHLKVLEQCFDGVDAFTPSEFKNVLQRIYSKEVNVVGLFLTRELQRYYVSNGYLEKRTGLLHRTDRRMDDGAAL